jgi:hypothetical protein
MCSPPPFFKAAALRMHSHLEQQQSPGCHRSMGASKCLLHHHHAAVLANFKIQKGQGVSAVFATPAHGEPMLQFGGPGQHLNCGSDANRASKRRLWAMQALCVCGTKRPRSTLGWSRQPATSTVSTCRIWRGIERGQTTPSVSDVKKACKVLVNRQPGV